MLPILLTPEENRQMEKWLRNEFDRPFDYCDIDRAQRMLGYAKRWGYEKLAAQMEKDMGIPSPEQVTSGPHISPVAELKTKEPCEIMVEQYNQFQKKFSQTV